MEPLNARKTYKYRLNPTPVQEYALEVVLSRCHTLYNVALEQRKTWWERGQGKGATYYQQKAELPDLKAACPDYAEINAQVLQDVILRVERAFQAFFRRLKQGDKQGAGGKTPEYPRFQGWGRYNSFTYPQYRGGVVPGWRGTQPLEDWPHPSSAASAPGRRTQDGHDPSGSRCLVRLYLLCGRAH